MILWYGELERRLLEILHFVPFSEENRSAHLPLLAPVIVEAGSIIDTVFREEYTGTRPDGRQLGIGDFASHYEPMFSLAELRSLIYQYPPRLLAPFRGWTSEKTGNYSGLDWWLAHNKLKHNRVEEHELATLHTAVNILCALHQVLSTFPVFVRALWRHDFLASGNHRHLVGENIEDTGVMEDALVETALFATSVGQNRFPNQVRDITPFWTNSQRLARFLGRQ